METGKPVKTIVLRVLIILSFLISAIVLFVSHQKVDDDDAQSVVRFADWNGFVFCAVVDCIVSSYNLLVIVIPAGSQLWKTVVVLDVIMDITIGASLGVGWQTYILMNQGNEDVRWCPICGKVPFFCSKILGSLITSTFGFLLTILLLIYILHVTIDPFLVGNSNV